MTSCNGQPYATWPATTTGDVTLAWSHRARANHGPGTPLVRGWIPFGVELFETSNTAPYLYARSSSTGKHLPLPYVGAASGWATEISVVGANVVIKTGANLSSYDETKVVLEYVKA